VRRSRASRPERLRNCFGTKQLDNPLHGVGEHVQAHLRAHPLESARQETRRAHPGFDRAKRMFDRLSPDSHHAGCVIEVIAQCSLRWLSAQRNGQACARCAKRATRNTEDRSTCFPAVDDSLRK
jgi:hypothetical protein